MIQTVDAIIIMNEMLLLIKRKNSPFGLALPGGKIKGDESTKDALKREVFEEVGLKIIKSEKVGYYDSPKRDPRGDYASTAFYCECSGIPKAADDAKEIVLIYPDEIDAYKDELAFDHYDIIKDFMSKQ